MSDASQMLYWGYTQMLIIGTEETLKRSSDGAFCCFIDEDTEPERWSAVSKTHVVTKQTESRPSAAGPH